MAAATSIIDTLGSLSAAGKALSLFGKAAGIFENIEMGKKLDEIISLVEKLIELENEELDAIHHLEKSQKFTSEKDALWQFTNSIETFWSKYQENPDYYKALVDESNGAIKVGNDLSKALTALDDAIDGSNDWSGTSILALFS